MVQAVPFLALEFLSSLMLGKQGGKQAKHDSMGCEKTEGKNAPARRKERKKGTHHNKKRRGETMQCKQCYKKLKGLLG
jgi:hypothetical protein